MKQTPSSSPKPQLLYRPYRAPKVSAGEMIYCEHHDHDVEVAGFTTAPLAWPAYRGLTGRLTPVLSGDLCRAVHRESAVAVAYWWGVSRETVSRWRKKLGSPRFTEGTTALWRALMDRRLPLSRRQLGARRQHEKAIARKQTTQQEKG